MTCSASDVFCDHLSVTYSPDNVPVDDAVRFLLGVGVMPARSDAEVRRVYRCEGDGTAVIEQRSTWAKVSASGRMLWYLRSRGALMEYLSLLADSPHSVSRLDAALDVGVDYPVIRRRLRRRFPSMRVRLNRKAVDVTELIESRPDGAVTGTYYVGQRGKTRSLVRVYDKAFEAEKKRSEILPPTTRYEVEVGRKFGATLRDAAEPAPLFFHVISPSILPRPDGVAAWEPGDLGGWSFKRPELTHYEALARFIDRSPDLEAMRRMADQLGPYGSESLLALLTRRLNLPRLLPVDKAG